MLQELIKEWREFIETYWNIVGGERTVIDGIEFVKKPSFYDFMQWLSDKYK